jgi:hypothetical protein
MWPCHAAASRGSLKLMAKRFVQLHHISPQAFESVKSAFANESFFRCEEGPGLIVRDFAKHNLHKFGQIEVRRCFGDLNFQIE